MKQVFTVRGRIVDLIGRRLFPGRVEIAEGRIVAVIEDPTVTESCYLMPGFVDAHVHVESSMLVPSEFARLAVVHGTVATISDPHEIGNVLGIEGVRYMLENAKKVPFHFCFGAPSCVPATAFETAGAEITAQDIRRLFTEEGLHYLSEMMNFPGVLQRDPKVMEKIEIAKELGKRVDGHAPGLCGELAKQYIDAGIETDHECFMLQEALDKVKHGMKILIREGSAAKNFEALHTLLESHPDSVMFCSDDKHPHELVEGHINQLVKRAVVDKSYDLFNVLRAACLHPVEHYKLDVGLLRVGDSADFIVVDDLKTWRVSDTYVKGKHVAGNGKTLIPSVPVKEINHFCPWETTASDFRMKAKGSTLRVIEALDGELITKESSANAHIVEGLLQPLPEKDLLKLVVVNRYRKAPPAIAFIKGFGLKKGALASCVAHDSHNIVAVGVSDEAISNAVNALMDARGGISVETGGAVHVLPLPVAGLMSGEDGYQVAQKYAAIDLEAKKLGSPLHAPFMTLSFMALLVIPNLKLSDKGLFDAKAFQFTSSFRT